VPVADALASQRRSPTSQAVSHLEGATPVYHRLPLVYRGPPTISP
jgi:hypothetical protein